MLWDEELALTSRMDLFDRIFGAWEKTGLATGFRESVEMAATRRAADRLNRMDQRHVKLEAAAGYPSLHRRYEQAIGIPLNLNAPRAFTEKIQWSKIYDRNPLYPIIADKAGGKDWIAERLGEDLTVPTLFQIMDPRDLPQNIAEQELILKVTHASRRNIVVSSGIKQSRGDILRRLGRYLYRDYGVLYYEWQYSEIERSIIAEPLLSNKDGTTPQDLQLLMFDGKLSVIRFATPVFSAKTGQSVSESTVVLKPDWTEITVSRLGDVAGKVPPRPVQFDRIVEVAQRLSEGFPQVRVDFFVVDDDFYVGELTFSTSGGLKRFDPMGFDYELGSQWRLPR